MRAMPLQPFIDVQLIDHPVRMMAIEPFPREAGGECVFLGRTRLEHHPQHGELQRLSYEAYREMAERVLHDLARLAIERYDCLAVRVHHALGEVPVGEASVLVQVACGHRDKAFEACRFLIDRLKTDAPIWKREQWERGETWSEAASVPDQAAAGATVR
jgi:molybdopterin synthase catalytic subunit